MRCCHRRWLWRRFKAPGTEAANGIVAQAPAACGRGIAVVSGDARIDLIPVPIRTGGKALSIRLITGRDSRSVAAASSARSRGGWVRRVKDRYGMVA